MSRIHVGDCRVLLGRARENVVDAVVTDPPYGLGFMGAKWDHAVPGPDYWEAALRVAKPGAHLVAFGGTRVWHRLWCAIEDAGWEVRDTLIWLYGQGMPKSRGLLKPAWEPIVLAVKPGGRPRLNIDGCRLDTVPQSFGNGSARRGGMMGESRSRGAWNPEPGVGRWPANVVLDEVAARALDAQAGPRDSHGTVTSLKRAGIGYGSSSKGNEGAIIRDSGGASRFFYCPKATRRERNIGGVVNRHVTVKPVALMRWLVRLVAGPGALVLDPFAGSGTTGIAAALERVRFVGCELDPKHAELAARRIEAHKEAA
jgi:site-specific DNA-methyltransferase (adenine-specific)